MSTPLFIPATLHDGVNTGQILIPFVDALPFVPTSNRVLILSAPVGVSDAGMYTYEAQQWKFSMPIEAVSAIVVNGDAASVYINVVAPVTLPGNAVVYKNGQLQPGQTLTPGAGVVYAVRLASSAVAGVASVNGMTGVVTLDASNLPGLSVVGQTGLYSDLIGAPGPYTLPAATAVALGGVIVPVSSSITVDGAGNIDISPVLIGQINSKLSTLTSLGAGSSLIASQSAGNANLRSLVAGANVTISDDGNNGLVVATSGGISSVTLTGDVTGTGTGTVPAVLAPSGVTAGTFKSVTVDAKGRVTNGTNPNTLAGFGITDALALSGGSMTGVITMTGGTTVKGVPDPVAATDAANRNYVDASVAAIASGVFWKTSVHAATVANVALSGLGTVDGYTPIAGDRVLVKDQTNATENGIYAASSGAWVRTLDADTGAEIYHAAMLILNGTVNALAQWTNTNSVAPVLGTDNVTFGQLKGAANVYVAGAGLSLTGLTFAIAATGVTPGTFTKVTVNAQGQVTTGANFNTSDITTALGYTPYNGTTNPNGYIGTASPINITGDATGTGTTAINLTLANSGVTAGTWTKVTVDAKGRVTVGANLTNAEISAAIGYTPANKAGDTFTGAVNFAPSATLASAATVAIGASVNDVTITGTTTITAFDIIAAGAHRWVTFSGILTLTHNAVNMILPTAASITTAAGDVAEFVSLGGGNWKCLSYNRASGSALVGAPDPTKLPLAGGTLSGPLNNAPSVSLASASTVAIGAAAANDVTITGAVTITAFDTIASGAHRYLTFTATLTLTHNASSLILPSGANITTAAGDVAEFVSLGGGNWKCVGYQKANGQAVVTGSGSPFSTTQVFNGDLTQVAEKLTNVVELATIIGTAPFAVQNFYLSSSAVQFHTANATAAWIPNFAHSAGVSLNSAMAVGDSVTVAHMVTQGGTAFFPSTFRIDGVAVTPKWQGGTAPTTGNINGIDVYSFTIIKTANATFTVLAAQTQFK